MIASQFNLDQRLAEFRDSRSTEFADQASAPEAASPVARIGAILRSLIGGSSAGQPTRAAAH